MTFSAIDYMAALERVRYLNEHPIEFPPSLTDQMSAASKENHRIAEFASMMFGHTERYDVTNMNEKIPAIMLGYYDVLEKCEHVNLGPRPLIMFPPMGLMYCAECQPVPTVESETALGNDDTCDMCGNETLWLRPIMMIHGFVTLHIFICLACDDWVTSPNLETPSHFPIN